MLADMKGSQLEPFFEGGGEGQQSSLGIDGGVYAKITNGKKARLKKFRNIWYKIMDFLHIQGP